MEYIEEADYDSLIIPYQDAMANLMTRLDSLNNDYRRKYKNYPIHHMQERIKKKESIEEKLRRKGCRVSAEEARENLTDIAGIRIICYFEEDIYHVLERIKRQTDILILQEKDYIRQEKENGYRSLHIIVGIPVYHIDGMDYYPVEIQMRTMAMDLWASMEHRVCYKKLPEHRDELAEAFCQYADILGKIEEQFEAYNETGMLEEITPAQITENPTEG